jgi:uncharacterized short protein YbdD (DUF466 family)
MKAIRRLIAMLSDLAKELADESAYARHLKTTGQEPSRETWRQFSDVRLRRKYQNGKCC